MRCSVLTCSFIRRTKCTLFFDIVNMKSKKLKKREKIVAAGMKKAAPGVMGLLPS